MSIIKDPLLGFEASGSLGASLTMRKTRSGLVVSRYATPKTDPSLFQQNSRKRFRTLSQMWRLLVEEGKVPWQLFASKRPLTGMNAFMGANLSGLKAETDFKNFLASPGAGGAIQPDKVLAFTFPDPGTICITVDLPPVPEGWTLQTVNAIAFPNQNPEEIFEGPLIVASGEAGELILLVEGLPEGTECMVGVWLTWIKPSGNLAYSISSPPLAPVTTASLGDNFVIGPEVSTSYALVLWDNTTGNLLKDSARPYQEGVSYNPVLAFGGLTTGITYVQRAGRYSRIGDSVFVSGFFQLSSKGTPTGIATVTLPLTSINESLAGFVSIPAYFNMSGVTAGGLQAFVQANATTFSVVEPGAASHVAVTHAKFSNTSWLFFAGLYRVPPL